MPWKISIRLAHQGSGHSICLPNWKIIYEPSTGHDFCRAQIMANLLCQWNMWCRFGDLWQRMYLWAFPLLCHTRVHRTAHCTITIDLCKLSHWGIHHTTSYHTIPIYHTTWYYTNATPDCRTDYQWHNIIQHHTSPYHADVLCHIQYYIILYHTHSATDNYYHLHINWNTVLSTTPHYAYQRDGKCATPHRTSPI